MTSIEWMLSEIFSLITKENSDGSLMYYDTNGNRRVIPSDIIEQAKEMHKQEIISAHMVGDKSVSSVDKSEQYYQETFSKGSDDHIADISKMVDISQQETLYTEEQVREELIGFQIYLNNKGFITNHDWDFEKLAKNYIKSLKQPKKD